MVVAKSSVRSPPILLPGTRDCRSSTAQIVAGQLPGIGGPGEINCRSGRRLAVGVSVSLQWSARRYRRGRLRLRRSLTRPPAVPAFDGAHVVAVGHCQPKQLESV